MEDTMYCISCGRIMDTRSEESRGVITMAAKCACGKERTTSARILKFTPAKPKPFEAYPGEEAARSVVGNIANLIGQQGGV